MGHTQSKCILVEEALWRVGESTFAWKLCHNWGKGKLLQQYQLRLFSWGSVTRVCEMQMLSLTSQGVVTYMSPVEVFVTRIKIFDQQKVCLIVWLCLLKLLIAWFFYWSKVKLKLRVLDLLIFAVRRSRWSRRLSKRALIARFNFDSSHKRFHTGHISDYPLPLLRYFQQASAEDIQDTGGKRMFLLF